MVGMRPGDSREAYYRRVENLTRGYAAFVEVGFAGIVGEKLFFCSSQMRHVSPSLPNIGSRA